MLDVIEYVTSFLHIKTLILLRNVNKLCITLDLSNKEGKEQIYELIKISDVFIENFRASVVDRLGLDYESVKKINKSAIKQAQINKAAKLSTLAYQSSSSLMPPTDIGNQGSPPFTKMVLNTLPSHSDHYGP